MRVDYLFFPPRVSISANTQEIEILENKHVKSTFNIQSDCKIRKQHKQNSDLILVSSSTSSLLQPWVHPENASMSISYLKWSTRNGPFCLRSLITFLPNSSIWGVNLRAPKLTRQRSFWISKGWPLLASRASVRFRWTTLYFCIKGRICKNKHVNYV